MYDVIVVGARCAGSPTAMLLARKGYRALLLDQTTFPSDTVSTHYIHPPGVAQLRRWGLLEKVQASNCQPITKLILHLGATGHIPPIPPNPDGQAEAYCPRRTVLDKILVDAAVDAGAELREGFSVRGIVTDGDRVTGIRGSTNGISHVKEEACLVIGADGLRSTVARIVKAPEYNAKRSVSFGYYSYWSGVPLDGAEIYFLPGAAILVFPTNDRFTCIIAGGPKTGFLRFRQDIEGNFLKLVDMAPRLAERVRNGRREECFLGTADQPNFFRRPGGPGWALVGDAGYHKDFITGLGITDAFRDAELLAEAIDDGFSGRQPLDEALTDYERRRNEIVLPLYEITYRLASGGMPTLDQFVAFGSALRAMDSPRKHRPRSEA